MTNESKPHQELLNLAKAKVRPGIVTYGAEHQLARGVIDLVEQLDAAKHENAAHGYWKGLYEERGDEMERLKEQLEAAHARIAHLEQSWHDSASMATYTSSVAKEACVCGEINTRHCPVHAGGSNPAKSPREIVDELANDAQKDGIY